MIKNIFEISDIEKNRILGLHESATKRQYLPEQVVTNFDSVYDYKKEGDRYFTKKKNSNQWVELSGEPLNAVKTRVFKVGTKPAKTSNAQTQSCPALPKSAGISSSLLPQYQNEAKILMKSGIPQRTACEISFVKIRPQYKGKPFFVVDTLHNLIYLYDQNGKFVAKSPMLDGYHAQSQETEIVAKALLNFADRVNQLGFKWDSKQKKYIHTTDQSKKFDNKLIYNQINKDAARFIPKGIYSIGSLSTKEDYAGGENNVFWLQDSEGKKIIQAIHGFFNEAPRVEALNQMKATIGTGVSSPAVPDDFIKLVENYMNTSKFNKSYGCINVPVDFLKKAQPYAKQKANVFVIGETEQNYLVQNDAQFFEQMGGGQKCVDPTTLGTQIPNLENVA